MACLEPSCADEDQNCGPPGDDGIAVSSAENSLNSSSEMPPGYFCASVFRSLLSFPAALPTAPQVPARQGAATGIALDPAAYVAAVVRLDIRQDLI